jgi:hypothetical protein
MDPGHPSCMAGIVFDKRLHGHSHGQAQSDYLTPDMILKDAPRKLIALLLLSLTLGTGLLGCADKGEQENLDRMQKSVEQQRGAMKPGMAKPTPGTPPAGG